MKETLLKSAEKLKQPDDAYKNEYRAKQVSLAAKSYRTLAARPDFIKLIGNGNLQMAEDNNRNFARFMDSLFIEYSPEVFLETVLWVFRAYRSHGFQTTYWAANLNIWVDLLREELSNEAFNQIYPFYDWLIINIPIFVKITDKDLIDQIC